VTNPKNIKELATGRTDLYRVDPRQLHIKPGLNCRELDFNPADEHDLALANSIAQVGVKIPLEVFWEDSKAYVSDGHRRLKACLHAIKSGAELKSVPVQVVDRHSNEGDRILSQIIRNSGKPLTALEQAKVYKRLIDLGWLSKDIAAKAGVTPARISQVMDLLAMPEPVKQMVQAGTVSPSLAAQTVKASGPEAIQVLTNAVATAQADGRTKAKPSDMNDGRKNVITQLKDCFDNSDIDNSTDDGRVIIVMSEEDFEIVRQLLKL